MLLKARDLIAQSWHLYCQNFKTLFKVSLWFFLPLAAAYLPFLIALPLKMNQNNIFIYSAIIFIYLILILFFSWILINFTLVIHNLYTEKKEIKLKQIYLLSLKKMPSFLLVYLLSGLVVLGGSLLLIIPGLILSIYLFFSVFVNILENVKGLQALKESKNLVKGNWWAILWRLFASFLVFTALFIGIMFFIQIIVSLMIFGLGALFNLMGTEKLILSVLLLLIPILLLYLSAIALAPLYYIPSVILYSELKKEKKQ